MLLAVAAACAGETVEVPGETVVVEKVVTETVEVPGETVVVEKEVIKTVEVPGETVTKEVVKEVMVPGETVVVKEEVIKTVEVPGQTVVKEVVKTVEVPGQTVVVEKEVVKTVEVPGQTVVVEKEVVKTVEVAGPERVVVKEVPGKKYVTDPSTGKVVSAPEYGGTITFARESDRPHASVYYHHVAGELVSGVVERLTIADWALDRDVFNYRTTYMPDFIYRGHLAESWEQPDDTTFIFNIRKGVYWHDKAPMNGRELTAKDIEYNLHRYLGLGSGYTEPAAYWASNPMALLPWESITATDKWTLVFKLTKVDPDALGTILKSTLTFTYPPEVIEEHGDVKDWRNLVGTGPFELTDWVEGSSRTWTKNPDYWGYDEKYPENRLPYIDEIRVLIMPDAATRLAALRSAKIDEIHGITQITSIDQVESFQRTNPEIEVWPIYNWASVAGLNVNKPPFDDIRVRQAMQMALDLETINNAFFKGHADTTPHGQQGKSAIAGGYAIPFEEWPAELKKEFDYDPNGAEALLDAAGYPRGADGIRFKTVYTHLDRRDLNVTELFASYLSRVGIDVEIDAPPIATFASMREDRSFEMISHSAAYGSSANPLSGPFRFVSTMPANSVAAEDADYDALYEAAVAATTIEELQRLTRELDMYPMERHWFVWWPMSPVFDAVQPWVKGYNGEFALGFIDGNQVLARLWIDQELKEAMGH